MVLLIPTIHKLTFEQCNTVMLFRYFTSLIVCIKCKYFFRFILINNPRLITQSAQNSTPQSHVALRCYSSSEFKFNIFTPEKPRSTATIYVISCRFLCKLFIMFHLSCFFCIFCSGVVVISTCMPDCPRHGLVFMCSFCAKKRSVSFVKGNHKHSHAHLYEFLLSCSFDEFLGLHH